MTKFHRQFSFALIMITISCTTSKKDTNQQKTDEVIGMNNNDAFLFVGTYNSNTDDDEGIFLYKLNKKTGESDSLSTIVVKSPSYLTLSKDERYLYAVSQIGDSSTVSAFSFDKDKSSLSHINTVLSQGSSPCYIDIDALGRNVVTANYRGGSVSAFTVIEGGGLSEATQVIAFEGSGPNASRQKSSHLHSIRYSPDKKFLFATDLGADKVYRFNIISSVFEGQPLFSQSEVLEFDTPSGSGPRHFDFHPSGKYLYLLGELSGEVIVYDYNDGNLYQKQTIASDTLNAQGSADIHVSPNGKFLYSSNRLKGDGIAIFSIDENSGELSKVGYQDTGIHPRNFVITPDGSLLLVACMDDNKIQVFSIDNETGLLTNTNNDIRVRKPVCLKFATLL